MIMQTVVGYHRPESLGEALALLNREGPRSAVLGGGTSFNAAEPEDPVEVVDLQAIGLDGIRLNGSTVEIGAMVRLSDLANNDSTSDLLKELCRREGPNTLRNAATVGGTIAAGDPESELLAGFLVYQGQVTLAVLGGDTRTVGLDELLADRGMLQGAIITKLQLDPGGSGAVARTGRTPSDVSIVAAVARKTAAGLILALTGVASTPILVKPAEVGALHPPGDFRGSSDYRRHLAGILTRRVIDQLEGQA
jgi:CO/xanthine dehydrogenase FAD-binding subunit